MVALLIVVWLVMGAVFALLCATAPYDPCDEGRK